MEETMTMYAAALVFPENISKDLEELRARYQQYMSYTIIPHITLLYPFVSETDIDSIKHELEKVAARTKLFTLVLDGVEYFEGENNVPYIAIANKQPVTALFYDINRSIDSLLEEKYRGRYNNRQFVPHMTISEQIPDEVFPEVKKQLAGFHPHYECEITGFSLFSSEEDEIWKQEDFFEFSG
jgi:2'-5' RNA ligase